MADSPSAAAPADDGAVPAVGFNFKAVLQQLVQRGASDLHLKVGRPPTLRLHGELAPLDIGCTVLCPGPVATDIIERTRRLQPRRDEPLAPGPERDAGEARTRQMSNWLARGVPPDVVGQMVLTAVLENRLYIHTDRVTYAGIEARTRALLDAMPVEHAHGV